MAIESWKQRRPLSELVEHSQHKGHYQCPIAKGLFLSQVGTVWDDVRKVYKRPSQSGNGYLTVSRSGNLYLHILLAETFLIKPKDKRLTVNHMDGNKLNCSLANLEWTTYAGNSTHAYEIGLRDDVTPVLLLDIQSTTIHHFYSLSACSRFVNKNPGSLSDWLNGKRRYPFLGKYDVKRRNERWRGFTVADLGKRRREPREIIHILPTAKATIYGSAGLCSSMTGIRRNRIVSEASGGKPKADGEYFVWLDEFKGLTKGLPVITEKEANGDKKAFIRTPVPIWTENLETGKSQQWSSMDEFSKSVGVCKSAVAKQAKKVGRYKNYVIHSGLLTLKG